ncbi:MAG: hypothetical protein ACYCSO_03065 [Cuniculiplasma sp.]
MITTPDLDQISLVISGINIVVSIFLFVIAFKAVRKGLRIMRYLVSFFALVFVDSVFIVFTYFDLTYLSRYDPLFLEITAMIVMLLFYEGIIRGKKN